ncbi:MAG: ferritin family protein [Syntrophales bacterium]|nr:ferritin family protein [Syntrophales bacterium]
MEKRLHTLKVALDNEMKEREFYLKNAGRTSDPLGRAMFQQIADEEVEHYERLKQLKENWEKQGKWPDTLPLTVKGTAVKDILKEMVEKVSQMEAGDDDDLKAIRTAIAFEAQGATFYARLRDEVSEPKEKAFFNLLADIEHEHFVSLRDTEEFLTDPASWYRKRESTSLDGA